MSVFANQALRTLEEIYKQLGAARGNPHIEGPLMPILAKAMGRDYRSNDSTKAPYERLMTKVIIGHADCWYYTGYNDALGYGRLLCLGENKAHRVSYRVFVGDIPEGMKVLHRCDVRNCVNPQHLFLGTQADNVADMMAKGRDVRTPLHGELNPMHRLTIAKVAEIRQKYDAGGYTQKELAREYGVAVMTINRVVRRILWKGVQ